jgi:hypothetical protein
MRRFVGLVLQGPASGDAAGVALPDLFGGVGEAGRAASESGRPVSVRRRIALMDS